MTPLSAFAVMTEDSLCEHHTEHTAECGYVAPVDGTDCTHTHDESCGYIEAVAEVLCACTETDENGSLVHNEGCGYVAPVTGADCTHTHDDTCGYVEAVEGNPCTYDCQEDHGTVTSETEATSSPTEAKPACTCGTDDESIHATDCPAYAAPETAVCTCVEQCTEGNANVWCDVCGFDASACTGTDTAAVYDTTTYPLKIAGVDVTADNCAAITDDAITGGSVSYDPTTNTLTLNGATITSAWYYIISYTGTEDFTINLVGENTLTTNAANTPCITADSAKIIISGGGSLTATGGSSSLGIYVSELAINNTTVTANGSSSGIQAKNITISGSTVDATATDSNGSGIQGTYEGTITIENGSKVAATGESGYGIYASGGFSVSGSTLTANGSVYGLYVEGNTTISGTSHILASSGTQNLLGQNSTLTLPTSTYYWRNSDSGEFTASTSTPATESNVKTAYFELYTDGHTAYTPNDDGTTHSLGCPDGCAVDTLSSGTSEAHTWEDGECEVCGAACEHTPPAEWDCTAGYTCTVCRTAVEAVTSHTAPEDADCTKGYTCAVCGTEMQQATEEHNYYNGTCTVCGSAHTHADSDWQDGTCKVCGAEHVHTENFEPEFNWTLYADGTCYVYAYLYCADCGGYVDYASGNATQTSSVEPVDCLTPGSATYSVTLTMNGAEYTDTETYEVKSENHTGEFDNGFCSACDGYEQPSTQQGEYEWETVYVIDNAGKLFWFADYINNVSNEADALVTTDITIPEGKEWTPMLNFYGTFDGGFNTISGFNCVSDTEYTGMFGGGGYSYGTIKNIRITDSYFEGTSYVGALAGYHAGEIRNCYVDNTTVIGTDYTGALVGNLAGSMYNCYAYADSVIGSYNSSYATVEDCYYLSETETDDGGKTAAQFASGEVAYLLQFGQEPGGYYDENDNWVETDPDEVWGQTIGTEDYPVFDGAKVYQVQNCNQDNFYSNTNEDIGHTYGELIEATEAVHSATELKGAVAVHYYCTVCGTYFTEDKTETTLEALTGEAPTHTFGDEWQTGNGQHWKECSCGAQSELAVHTYDATTHTCVCGDVEKIVSVTITWGAMSFTYDDTLDEDGNEKGWTCVDGANVITVENTGNTDVTVTYTYEQVRTEIEGSFTDGKNTVTKMTILATEKKSVWLNLKNKPTEALTDARLGTVKLTIE